MEILSIVGQLILSLSILVTLHECGHFFPAKWFKTRVEKFYLFFDPWFSLFKITRGGTEYGIGWIPFGGYVKISGMIDESMDTEQMKQPIQPWEFRAKPAWQRLIIMLGGVTVNFILGFLIFAGLLWVYGKTYIEARDVSNGIAVEQLGEQMGLENGDKIISVGGVSFEKFNPGLVAQEIILNSPKSAIVERAGVTTEVNIPGNMAELLTKYENKGKKLFDYRLPQEIAEVKKGSIASEVGLEAGDRIIAVGEYPVVYFDEFNEALAAYRGSTVELMILRKEGNNLGQLQKSLAVPEKGSIGIFNIAATSIYPVQRDKYTLAKALPQGVNDGVKFLTDQLKAFGQMFKGNINLNDSLGSIVSIARMFDSSWNWERFWTITAMLSILLGFFNLLPIPALDGGYVMFLIWEVITGRKPSDKVMEIATTAGFFVLIGLMIYALGLDFSKLFRG